MSPDPSSPDPSSADPSSAEPSSAEPSSPDPLNPPIPPISGRDEPRFGSRERKQALAGAFQEQGADYDRLRPGYPDSAVDAMLAAVADDGAAAGGPAAELHSARAIDLGAGTGKLSWALAERGLAVTAVDTSPAMLEIAGRRVVGGPGPGPAAAPNVPGLTAAPSVPGPTAAPSAAAGGPSSSTAVPSSSTAAPSLATQLAPAEATGLPSASAELVTVAQAWHWFDADAASAEVARLLVPGGVLALVWNMLDVSIPWVHRLTRIMHAGDVQREDALPTVGPALEPISRGVHAWQDPLPTQDVIDLARTRSHFVTAPEERRAKVLANLDWYLHEHLGHARGETIGVPYRTDLFLYRLRTPAAGART